MILHGVSPPRGSYAQILSLHNFKQVQFILSIIILYSYKAQLTRVASMRLKKAYGFTSSPTRKSRLNDVENYQ